ncbi:hypothetical protein [Methanolobus sp. ZRKC5]|uniref:hypothetical protein n=1 Tax=unclassified Methanolobus TaxID=2629569 RepID=UPI00313B72D7
MSETEEIPRSAYMGSIAELIGTPGDVSYALQEKYFPFINKVMQLSNLTKDQIIDIQDDQELARIEEINGKRRYEISDTYTRLDFIQLRAYSTAALSLSLNGFAVKQIAGVHKSIEYRDTQKGNMGILGSFLKKGGNANE